MDRDLPFGYSYRQKRSHAQMELEGSSSPTWSAVSHLPTSREPSASASYSNHAGLHLPQPNNMPSATPRRYPGDGLDYRRPVTSSNVIDLTVEDAGPSAAPSSSQRAHTRPPRPPRFGREIMQDVIDLDAEDTRGAAPAPTSPEIEIISSRRLDPPRRTNPPDFLEHIADEDEDDVEFLSANPVPFPFQLPRLPELRRHPNNLNVNAMQALLSDMNVTLPVPHLQEQYRRRAERQRQTTMNRFLAHTHRHPVAPPRASRGRIHMDFLQPNFNYGEAAFDMGFGTADPDEEPAMRPSTYEAPGKAPLGFTRSPQEEDSLMCPNCGDELCVGESDLKKQVWIVKHCGHVYCGECTVNRSIKKSAKGKEKQAAPRTKPFKECVVEGCQKKVSNKSHMFQVFL